MLHIGGGFLAALDEYVQDIADVAPGAQDEAIDTLRTDLQIRATLHPRWEGLASHIETWRDKGKTIVGVRDPSKLAAAQQAEYGDQDSGPVPLIRHMPGSAKAAVDRMNEILYSELGIPADR